MKIDKGRVTATVNYAAREIAKKLLKRGLSNADIAEDTGLPIEQIEILRSEN